MLRNERGFTLIELVIVIVILGIMAALAIPKFLDIRADAKKSSIQGVLGGVRSAIANKYAKDAAAGVTPLVYATVALLTNGTDVLDGAVAKNPYHATPVENDVEGTTSAKGVQPCLVGAGPSTSTKAWCYNTTAGTFWANTNTAGVVENNF
jgi:prepilin-type N-terminal cleavage/methylation domain-containing protein